MRTFGEESVHREPDEGVCGYEELRWDCVSNDVGETEGGRTRITMATAATLVTKPVRTVYPTSRSSRRATLGGGQLSYSSVVDGFWTRTDPTPSSFS